MSDVVALHAIEGGYDFDALFESLKGHPMREVLVITENGSVDWYGNVKAGDAMVLMERLRDKLVKECSDE
jgi:hypothetical protein